MVCKVTCRQTAALRDRAFRPLASTGGFRRARQLPFRHTLAPGLLVRSTYSKRALFPVLATSLDDDTAAGPLLTHSEGSYFNYYLNQVEFSDGPGLRNKYLHGSQAGGYDKRQHFAKYTTALKLLIALVIKMNDEFWLRDEERKRTAGNAEGSA